MDIVAKIQNKVLYYFSSGSPLRLPIKLARYGANLRSTAQRKNLALKFRKEKDAERVTRILAEKGTCPVTPEIDKELFNELLAASTERVSRGEKQNDVEGRKYFGEYLNKDDRTPDSIYVRFALQEKIIKMVSAHLGQVPKLFGVSLLLSKPNPGGGWIESQLWHRDYDDTKILKLFVYLSDVDTKNDGPFTFIPPKASKKVGRRFVPKRVTDEEMLARGGTKYVQEIYGKQGTAFLIDTARCYHMGSRCHDSQRLAYIATFTTPAPLDKRQSFPKITGLPQVEQLVLGN